LIVGAATGAAPGVLRVGGRGFVQGDRAGLVRGGDVV